MEDKLMSFKEVAKYLSIPEKAVKFLLRKNGIPVHILGHRTRRVNSADIKRMIEETKQQYQTNTFNQIQ